MDRIRTLAIKVTECRESRCQLELAAARRVATAGGHGGVDASPRAPFLVPPSQMLGDCSVIRLAAGFRPDPLGELVRSPRTSSRNGGIYTSKKREGRRGRVGGLLLRRGKEEEGFFI